MVSFLIGFSSFVQSLPSASSLAASFRSPRIWRSGDPGHCDLRVPRVPSLREYRYIERDNRTYVIEPRERTIIEEID
jgi:hypothetical protein